MSEPVIKERFQFEISRVKNNEEDLQETYRLRQHAGDAVNAVFAAKIALADAVIAAGGGYTRDDLVRAAVEIMQLAGCNACECSDVEAEVDRLTKGET